MKKILYSIFAIAIALPVIASAATFSFAPSSGSFAPGLTFSVAVYINPSAGEEITVAKLSSVFSTNGLEVTSFKQADGWVSLPTPGSDLIDNTTGKLIKTAGFPARVKTSKLFGTLTLKSKSEGTATISVEGDSMMLDSTNANKFVASTGASFTIVTPIPKTTTVTTSNLKSDKTSVSTTKSKTKIEATSSTEKKPVENATTTEETIATTTQQRQVAAAASSGAGTKNIWYYLIAAIAILAGVLAWRKWGSKRNNNL